MAELKTKRDLHWLDEEVWDLEHIFVFSLTRWGRMSSDDPEKEELWKQIEIMDRILERRRNS